MAKFANPSKLSKEEREKLLVMFCAAFSKIKSPAEAAQFLTDLLSSQEAEMLAKRLRIAELLIGGQTYGEISGLLKVSSGTIARVHEWLKLSGDGFRLILERVSADDLQDRNQTRNEMDADSWRNIKRKYPLYFWPQLLLESVVRAASEKDKKRISETLKLMDKKSALHKQLNRVLKRRS